MPSNYGFMLWADQAFGSFAGSMMGSWKFMSGSINIASYPVLCMDYLSKVLLTLEKGLARVLTIVGASLGLSVSVVNYVGFNFPFMRLKESGIREKRDSMARTFARSKSKISKELGRSF